jgi:hypothetical protein
MASDFFTVEVWTPRGLQRSVILFFMELSTRRLEIGGIASRANGLWMTQIARNLTDDVDGFFKGKRYLIHDRDPLYTKEFLSMLAERDIEEIGHLAVRQHRAPAAECRRRTTSAPAVAPVLPLRMV